MNGHYITARLFPTVDEYARVRARDLLRRLGDYASGPLPFVAELHGIVPWQTQEALYEIVHPIGVDAKPIVVGWHAVIESDVRARTVQLNARVLTMNASSGRTEPTLMIAKNRWAISYDALTELPRSELERVQQNYLEQMLRWAYGDMPRAALWAYLRALLDLIDEDARAVLEDSYAERGLPLLPSYELVSTDEMRERIAEVQPFRRSRLPRVGGGRFA